MKTHNHRPGQVIQHQRPCPRTARPIGGTRMALTLAVGVALAFGLWRCQH